MDFSLIDEFIETYWSYENTIIDHILNTGKRHPFTLKELEYFKMLDEFLGPFKKDISKQLSQNSESAPALLVYIQDFLNDVFSQREALNYADQISVFLPVMPLHRAIPALQSYISSLSRAYNVELKIYEPNISTGKSLTDKEKLFYGLFPEEKNRKKALAVINRFSISEKPKIWQLSGFLLVMKDQKLINQKISTVEQEKLIRKYFLGEPKRINNNSNKAYNFSKDISSFLKKSEDDHL